MLTIEELLDHFPISHLGYALVTAGMAGGGPKHERIQRLVAAGRSAGTNADQLLALFKTEALRPVCSRFGLEARTKQEMVEGLAGLLLVSERGLSPVNPDLGAPTLPAVLGFLRRLTLPARLVRSEADAERAIATALSKRFTGVSTQFSVGGYLGYRIDIDLGDGQVGVEVKLAASVVASASEAYRTLGQALVYDRRKYRNRVIVAMVGLDPVREQPAYGEIEQMLKELGATPVFIGLRSAVGAA